MRPREEPENPDGSPFLLNQSHPDSGTLREPGLCPTPSLPHRKLGKVESESLSQWQGAGVTAGGWVKARKGQGLRPAAARVLTALILGKGLCPFPFPALLISSLSAQDHQVPSVPSFDLCSWPPTNLFLSPLFVFLLMLTTVGNHFTYLFTFCCYVSPPLEYHLLEHTGPHPPFFLMVSLWFL